MTTIYCLDSVPLRALLDNILASGARLDAPAGREAFLRLAAEVVQAEERDRLDAEWHARKDAEPNPGPVEVVVEVPAPEGTDLAVVYDAGAEPTDEPVEDPAPAFVCVPSPEPAPDREALKREATELEAKLILLDHRAEIRDARLSCDMDPDRPLASSRARVHTLTAYRNELRRRLDLFAGAPTPPQEAPEPEPEPEGVPEPADASGPEPEPATSPSRTRPSPWADDDDLPAATALPDPLELF